MMTVTLLLSLLAAAGLRYLQFPAVRRHLQGGTHPALLMLDVGFTVGLAMLVIAPIGLLIRSDVGSAIQMTGFTILALIGFASFYAVRVRGISVTETKPTARGFSKDGNTVSGR